MALRPCEDCKKDYSDRAAQCIHCGAPNPLMVHPTQDDSNTLTEFVIGCLIVGVLLFFYGKDLIAYAGHLLNSLNVGVLSESQLQDCENDRIKTSMKQTFDESAYAQTYHLKAITIQTSESSVKQKGSILACNATLTTNSAETFRFIYQFKKHEGGYLIEAQPR